MLTTLLRHALAGLALGAVSAALPAEAPALGARLAAASGSAPLAAGRPNILLIVLDDVSTDQLELYGETPGVYARTPHIDALAQRGILFRNFYVNPLCSTTRACMQSGRYAFRHGMGGISDWPVGNADEVVSSDVLVAELLRDGFQPGNSYRSGIFGKWHLSHGAKPGHAVQNGYDRFRGMAGNTVNHFSWRKIEHDAGGGIAEFLQSSWSASVARADAVEWINQQSSPYFACVAFNPPHKPFQVPPHELLSEPTRFELEALDPLPTSLKPPLRGDPGHRVIEGSPYVKLYYRAMLEAVDHEIGNLLAGIDPNKLGNTMVFLVSDNGTTEAVISSPHDPAHGKGTTYQYGVRVPMIVAGPLVPLVPEGHELGRWETDQCVGAVDLWRTFAALSGASEALAFQRQGLAQPCLDSISFAELLADPTASGARALAFSQGFTPNEPPSPCLSACLPDACLNACRASHRRALTDGNYKYILTEVTNGVHCAPYLNREELYQVSVDPDEQFNRIVLAGDDLQVQGDTAESDAAYQHLKAEMRALSGD